MFTKEELLNLIETLETKGLKAICPDCQGESMDDDLIEPGGYCSCDNDE